MFFRGSRYEPVREADITTDDGRVVRYKRIRFIPDERGVVTYEVIEGDRPDLVAHKVYGNPELFWRICDGNGVLRPDELTERPGRRVEVPGS
jgi:hypothetical protein